MEPDYWRARWRDGLTGWHREEPNPHLLRHAIDLLGDGSRSVLVPLAGKSVDLRWLSDQGHRVTAIELSEDAILAYHEEQGIDAVIETQGSCRVHSSPGLRVLEGDLFSLPAELVGKHEVLYDRAALIALRPDQRGPYVGRVRSFLEATARGLVLSLNYDQSLREGPPHSVEESEIRRLWGSSATLRKLGERSCLDDSPDFREAGLDRMDEEVWLLDLRGS